MRGFLAFLFLGLIALGAGAIGYNIGVSQAVATTAASSGATVVYAGGWHWGGLFFLPFAFFLVPLMFVTFFGFLAFAFGPRRHWRRHWDGDRAADGYGPTSGFGPGGWDSRRQWVAEQHRRLHEEEARAATSTPADPTGTTPGGPAAA